MPVNSHHPEYYHARKRWDMVRAIDRNDAACYLRVVDVNDPIRSEQYKNMAVLTNYTSLTKDGLIGLIYRREPKVVLPTNISYLAEDATGEGLGLNQFSQQVCREVLLTGRYGVVVDYPSSGPMDKQQMSQSYNKATLKAYKAESIINWGVAQRGNTIVLSQVVVIEDNWSQDEDGFAWNKSVQYRVFRLDAEGYYEQILLDIDENVIEYYQPRLPNGERWSFIPFQFFGADDNDWRIDEAPLYNLACVNLAHYRNSADLEESIFLTGQPMLVLGGAASVDNFKAAYPNGVKFGSRGGIYLGQQPYADLLQVNPNQMVDVAMQRKEDQMVAIGARIITKGGTGRETAEGARIREGSSNSALYNVATNVSIGITQLIKWVQMYMTRKIDESVSFVLNSDFIDESADPNLVAQQIMLKQEKVISAKDIRDYGRKTGFIDRHRTDEDIEKDIASDPVVEEENAAPAANQVG
jgi:hypothetical protein